MNKNNIVIKRFLGILLTVIMVISSSSAVFAATSFSDLKKSPYKTAVNKLVKLNIINGYEDGTFKPENNITRAETCIVISKAMAPDDDKYEMAEKNSFSDVDSNFYGWAEKYINYAAAMGVVEGYPSGEFIPANNVTYNELAAMILKGIGYKASELIGVWPDNFKNKAQDLGIYDGVFKNLTAKEKKSFDYESAAIRGDAVLMVNEALEKLQKKGKEALPEKPDNGNKDGNDNDSGGNNDNGDIDNDNDNGNDDGNKYDWISGDASNLSLQEAVSIMQYDGYLADMAKTNRESDEAIVKGYSDSIGDIKDAIKSLKKLQSSRSDIEKNQDSLDSGIKQTKELLKNLEESQSEDPLVIEQIAQQKADLQQSLAEQTQLAQTLEASLAQVEAALDQMPTKKTLETNQKLVELQKSFAEANIDKNYNAELNSIESQTVALYYGVLQAEENMKVCEDNLAVQEKLLTNIELKYSVGVTNKMEVTSQQAAVNSAKQDIDSAKASLEKAKMNFNMLLGYDVKENIKLTDELKPLPFPEMSLSEAVDSAVKNRLSVAQMKYACDVQKLSLELLKNTDGKDSGAYKKQENALALTKLAYNNMPKTLEIEIRSAYIDMKTKYDAIAKSRETMALAEDGLKISETLYKSGMGTLADVQKAQVTVNQTNQLIMASISAYNTAVYDFNYLMGVGKERLSL